MAMTADKAEELLFLINRDPIVVAFRVEIDTNKSEDWKAVLRSELKMHEDNIRKRFNEVMEEK